MAPKIKNEPHGFGSNFLKIYIINSSSGNQTLIPIWFTLIGIKTNGLN